jgi:TPR repeat protein
LGKGCEVDLVLAHMWFALAARKGSTDAIHNCDAVAKQLKPEQLHCRSNGQRSGSKKFRPLKVKKTKTMGLGFLPYTAQKKRPSTGAFFLAKA